jgi:hypothetical protein
VQGSLTDRREILVANLDSDRYELHVYSVDGHVSRFTVRDAASWQKLLDHLQPGRVFAQPHLMVGSARSLSIFPTARVVRVDLVMEGFPDWPFPYGAHDIQEISAEQFETRYRPEDYDPGQLPADGAPIVVFVEIEVSSGQRLYLEVHTRRETRLPVEQGMFFQQILSAHSLFARRQGGGVTLLNPAGVVRLTFHPGPLNAPPGTLSAEPLSDGNASDFVLLLDP